MPDCSDSLPTPRLCAAGSSRWPQTSWMARRLRPCAYVSVCVVLLCVGNRSTSTSIEMRQKGLRDRNSPNCTLSQNGYGRRLCVRVGPCVRVQGNGYRNTVDLKHRPQGAASGSAIGCNPPGQHFLMLGIYVVVSPCRYGCVRI